MDGQALARARRDWNSDVSLILFSAIFLLFLVSPTPFRDFSNVSMAELEQANPLVQLSFGVVFLLAVSWLVLTRGFLLASLVTPPLVATLAWFALCSSFSADPFVSLKRLTLAAIVVALAGVAVTLPASLKQLSRLLAFVSLVTLGFCFFGIAVIPSVAIHHSGDLVEPHLQGMWRGVFQHKNIAAATMVVFVFVGLFVARVSSALMGWTIIVLAVLFLIGCGGKTAMVMCPVVLLQTHLCQRARGAVARSVVALGLFVLLSVGTVGSVLLPPVQRINEAVLPDASFTGRTAIWSFGVANIAGRPLFGHGFSSFWRAPIVVHSESETFDENTSEGKVPAWVKVASHSHNAFVDVGLAAGIPGILLTLWWLVLSPLGSLNRVAASGRDGALASLFVRIWLFGIYTMSLEALAFDRTNPVWLFVLFAMFGLGLLARRDVRAAGTASTSPPVSNRAPGGDQETTVAAPPDDEPESISAGPFGDTARFATPRGLVG